MLLGLTLLAVIALQVASLLKGAASSSKSTSEAIILEEQAQLVLQRIANAVLGSNRESLLPKAERPLSSSDIEYRIYLGVENGEVVWGDTELIGLDDTSGEIAWERIPLDGGEPLRVIWSKLASPYLAGEIPNGMDDNGNGLIDEKGLSFFIDRNAVTIQLTLGQLQEDGTTKSATVQTTVMCRNPGPNEVNP